MMKMTKTKTEQNGFFGDFSGDSQTCLGAALGVSVESLGQDKVLWAVWEEQQFIQGISLRGQK